MRVSNLMIFKSELQLNIFVVNLYMSFCYLITAILNLFIFIIYFLFILLFIIQSPEKKKQ